MSNPCKILVVDDEVLLKSLISQKFKKQIASNELEFYFAVNGHEALDIFLNNKDIGVVFTDIKMPEMDGLTFLHHLSKQDRFYKAVVVSAYGDISNIRKAMEEGACDFILKPFDMKDFEGSLARVVNQYTYINQGLKAKDEVTAFQKEIEIAKRIKKTFLPENFSPFPESDRISLMGEMLPSRDLGGDCFDFFPIGNQRLGIFVANVKAKGVSAALYTAMLQMLARAIGQSVQNPHECVQQIHEFITKEIPANILTGLFYGVLDIHQGELNYLNSGDILFYFIPYQENTIKMPEKNGKCFLKSRDKIFITTKTLTEAKDSKEGEYGEMRLQSLLKPEYSSNELIKQVKDSFNAFTENIESEEDIVLFSLSVN